MALLPPNHTLTKPARKSSKKHALLRIAAKQGWHDQQAGKPHQIVSADFTLDEVHAYDAGYYLSEEFAKRGEKHPFGEIDAPRIPK